MSPPEPIGTTSTGIAGDQETTRREAVQERPSHQGDGAELSPWMMERALPSDEWASGVLGMGSGRGLVPFPVVCAPLARAVRFRGGRREPLVAVSRATSRR